jgi:anti-sigma factor RsiW
MDSHPTDRGQCSRPPALDDLDLIAAADGEAHPDVLSHLAVCEHCAGRAQALTSLQGYLRQRLYRAFCPPTDDLVAYQHGLLAAGRRSALAAHLADCPHCSREMELIARAAHDPPHMLAPLRFARRIVAELLSISPAPGPMSLYGATRGTLSGAQYAYRADNLEITLRVERAVGRPGLLALSGSLATEDEAIAALIGEASASLLYDDSVLAVVPLDELGDFLFEAVERGEYRLALSLGTCEVVVEALTL